NSSLSPSNSTASKLASACLRTVAWPFSEAGSVAAGAFENGDEDYALERLLTERSVSVNTAAAGGNANLMTIG
ncbi:hypothetical protein PPH41_07995, partial [Burkholderia gladioli]|nr:hypothetical protein [Burkholderia gladioli]